MSRRSRIPVFQFPRRSVSMPLPQRPRSSGRRFHIERLEDRFLMTGDDTLVAAPVAVPTIPVVDVAAPVFASDDIAYIPYYPFTGLPTANDKPPFDRIDEIPDWIVAEADAKYGELFGKEYLQYQWGWPIHVEVGSGIVARSMMVNDGVTGVGFDLASNFSSTNVQLPSNFSSTNVQVAGVDEADLVETDGDYLYVISGEELIIVDARDTSDLKIASRVQLDGRPTGIYLSGDRLTLVAQGQTICDHLGALTNSLVVTGLWQPVRTNHTTTVTVLDIADRTAPTLVQRTELDGALVSSRMVDGQLRLVVRQDSMHFPDYLPQINRQFDGYDEATGVAKYRYDTRNEYLSRVHEILSSYTLPTYRTISVEGEVLAENELFGIDEVVRPGQPRWGAATTIATLDTQSDAAGPTATKTVLTASTADIYATEESLYVFGQALGEQHSWKSWNSTSIWKFDFGGEGDAIEFAARGRVEGRMLNQFAADEHGGYLRVVVTGNGWRSGQSLHVLEQVGRQLKVVGSVEDLAPGERLHSVRFMGDRAFLVTFRKVDPLFAIDLSDPTAPQLAGELKIPGYSDYLQPIDENHLLGIGRGADERRGLFEEMQLSIFDVSDLSDPQLAHRYSFDGGRSTASITTGGRWSQGDGDHHAVSYFPSAQVLAVPIHSEGHDRFFSRVGTTIFEPGEGGLQVFRIDVASGFEPTTLIEHESPIVRSLRIDDSLIAVSFDTITAHDLADPTQQVGRVELLVGSDVGLVELTAYQSITTADLQSLAAVAIGLPAGPAIVSEVVAEEVVGDFSQGVASGLVTPTSASSDVGVLNVLAKDQAFDDDAVGRERLSSELSDALAIELLELGL